MSCLHIELRQHKIVQTCVFPESLFYSLLLTTRGFVQSGRLTAKLEPDEVCDPQILYEHPRRSCRLKKERYISAKLFSECREMQV